MASPAAPVDRYHCCCTHRAIAAAAADSTETDPRRHAAVLPQNAVGIRDICEYQQYLRIPNPRYLVSMPPPPIPQKLIPAVTMAGPRTAHDAVITDAVITDAVITDAVIADAVITDAVIADAVIADAFITDAVIADAVITDAVIADAAITCDGRTAHRPSVPGVPRRPLSRRV
jgi:hypothetical protein